MQDMRKIYSVTPPGLMVETHNDGHGDDIERMPIGMAYVPRQVWRNIYNQDKGLMRGTIFEELDLPFMGGRNK